MDKVPVDTPLTDDEIDLFGEYRHLLPIDIEGTRHLVPEDNSVLRCLQYLELKTKAVKMAWGDYCWNNTTGCCEMTYRETSDAVATEGRACQIQVTAGLQIVKLPKGGKLLAKDE